MRNDIQKIVSRYIHKYETRNPFEIAKALNIEVLIGALGSRCGCYMYLKRHLSAPDPGSHLFSRK